MNTELAIKVKNLTLTGRRSDIILDNINFNVKQGETIGLIGPNGAGKTMLIKTLLGIIKPDKGEIEILGLPPQKGRLFVGYVPQFAFFNANFPITVAEIILSGLVSNKKGIWITKKEKKAIASILEKVELEDYINLRLDELSGGQVQRVLIARALAVKPKILFLDEPTASLDQSVEKTFYSIVDELKGSLTILIVSHDIGILLNKVDSLACLNKRLFQHKVDEINYKNLEDTYGCPLELVHHTHNCEAISLLEKKEPKGDK